MIMLGRIASDLRMKENAKGTVMCDFVLAKKNRFGEDSSFIDFTAFGKTAEYIEKYSKKGGRILVSKFDLTTNIVENENGKRKYYNFTATEVEIIDFKDKDLSPKEQDAEERQFASAPAKPSTPVNTDSFDSDDEFPF